MSFFWETSTETSSYNGCALSMKIENFFLYTRDMIQTRGWTYGNNAQPLSSYGGIHPDTFRTGRDELNTWTQIACFTKPTDNKTLIQIWVQDYVGLDDELEPYPGQNPKLFGKQFAIPLNSGPGYLATRDDEDYILGGYQHGNATSLGSMNWGACRSDAFDLYGYTENDIVQPSRNPRKPFTTGTANINESLAVTKTGSAYQNLSIVRQSSSSTGNGEQTGHFCDFTLTSGFLQDGGTSMDNTYKNRDPAIYTGGEFSIYALTQALKDEPAPDFAQMGIGANQISKMSLRDAAQIDSASDDTYDYRVYYLSDVLDISSGDNFKLPFTSGVSVSSPSSFNFPQGGETEFPSGAVERVMSYFDPWDTFAMPPMYTIPTTNNGAIKGGILI